MSDIFGAPRVCSASVVGWVGEKAEELTPVYERIGERVAGEKVRHLDETGYRIGGKLQWLHTTSSLCFTFYRAGEKRGDIPRNFQRGASSFTTTSSLTTDSSRSSTRSATPISCANSRA